VCVCCSAGAAGALPTAGPEAHPVDRTCGLAHEAPQRHPPIGFGANCFVGNGEVGEDVASRLGGVLRCAMGLQFSQHGVAATAQVFRAYVG